jgi:hypothetical protein
MAVIAEAKTERLVYKLYTDATYNSTTEPVMATDPGATGGQYLRHVTHNLNLAFDQYRPNEKRVDAQESMGNAGSKVLSGTINGFLSPGTQADLFKGVMRNPWTAAVVLTESDLTSVAMSASGSTIIYGGGDPVALGLKVGMQIAHTAITGTNLSKRFVILSFGGTSNRTLTVYPAPLADLGADTAFTVTSFKILTNPATGLTNYKYAFEWYNPDVDFSRFGSECRIGGFDLGAPVNNNVTLNFNVMGRNRTVLSGASSPFFTAPTTETTTDIPSSMQGLVRLNGSTLAVTTASTLKVDLKPQAAKVKNTAGLVGAINLENFMGTGDFTAFVDGSTLFDAYDNKTEMEMFQYFPTSNLDATPGQVFYTPRIRLTSCVEGETEGGKTAQCSYEIARYVGSTAGVNSTTLQISDTNA